MNIATPTNDHLLALILVNIEDLLDRLGVEYRVDQDCIKLECPVHGSSKINNSVIFLNSGVWYCYSNNCHENDCPAGGRNTALHLFLILFDMNIKNLIDFIDKGEHNKSPARFERKAPKLEVADLSKHPSVNIPSKYYINRGISPESLKMFGVGDCNEFPWFSRAIIPIKHINQEYLGFTARSHFDECSKCSYYHSKYTNCVNNSTEYIVMYNRWVHKAKAGITLYGIDQHSGEDKVVLVEGTSCVWRLWDHGVFAVACLSGGFNNNRKELLKSAGITKVMLAFDNDEAGQQFKQDFINKYQNDFQLHPMTLPEKDVSEMTDKQIKATFLKRWESI